MFYSSTSIIFYLLLLLLLPLRDGEMSGSRANCRARSSHLFLQHSKGNNGNNFLHSKNSELKCIANKRIKNKRGRGGARRRERQRNNSQQHVTDLKRSASVNNNKEKYKVSGLVCAQKKEHAARRCCSRKNNTKCTLVKQQLLCLSECIWWPRKWAKPNDRKKWIRRGFSFEIVLIYSGR